MNRLTRIFPRQAQLPIRNFQRNCFRNCHTSPHSENSSDFLGVVWDKNNRIRVLGSILGIIGVSTLAFDTLYNRVTKAELKEIETKIERSDANTTAGFQRSDAKIDSLRDAIKQTSLWGKSSAEADNQELRARNPELEKKLAEK